jgi:hypothetical protein
MQGKKKLQAPIGDKVFGRLNFSSLLTLLGQDSLFQVKIASILEGQVRQKIIFWANGTVCQGVLLCLMK